MQAHESFSDSKKDRRKLDSECGVKSLQVGWRRIDKRDTNPSGKRLRDARENVRWRVGDYRQIGMKIGRLLMLERDLLAFAPGLRRLGFLGFALTVCAAAAFNSRKHEELFARDAATPNKGGKQQQRKKQTG